MKASKGKILFDNGIELNLETGETTERFYAIPESNEGEGEGETFPSREAVLMILKREGIFTY